MDFAFAASLLKRFVIPLLKDERKLSSLGLATLTKAMALKDEI
jgi:hypothetical protein